MPACPPNNHRRGARSSGQVLVAVAIALPALLAIVGFAVDMGRLYVAKAKLQTAVDAAALAGSRELFSDPYLDNGRAVTAVDAYLSRNYPSAKVVELAPGGEVRGVCITARADVSLTFMAILGMRSRSIMASSCAGFSNLEVVLVIDNSGSMMGEPIGRVRRAAKQLVNLMMPGEESPMVKVGIVPFRGKVHVGNFADGLPPGCRNADGTVNTTHKPSCFNAIPPVLPLSSKKKEIFAAIDSMEAPLAEWASSGTVVSEGIKWGRHVLTPEHPYQEGGHPFKHRKVMIFVGDGGNDDGGCPGGTGLGQRNAFFGMGVTECDCMPNGCMDQTTRREADLTKQQNIEIFAIQFGLSDADDIELLKSIASSKAGTRDHYFEAPGTGDLEKIFKQIGQRLGFRLIS